MSFIVQQDIFDAFPGMCIAVAVASGVDNSTICDAVEAEWNEAWVGAQAATRYGNAQSHPRVAPWRERMKAVGVSGKQFPSSIEAVLRRALKGGDPFHIDPLVDFYNAVSLRHVVPAGGFDLDQIIGPLELRLSREGDTFQALDEGSPEHVALGEVSYADGSTVLTKHFVWRQSREALITENTRNVILISEVLGEIDAEVANAVLDDFLRGLHEHFGVEPRGGLVAAESPSFHWDD